MPKAIDLSGQRFGKLLVVHYVESRITNSKMRRYYLAKCDCGQEKIVLGVTLGKVNSCGCLRKRTGSTNPKWTGHGEISGNFWDYIKIRCDRSWSGRKRKTVIPFEIDIKYAWELFLSQNRKCSLTGLVLKFGRKNKTASLDRIDSSKGYIEGNVQWVHKDINLMKQSFSQETFIEYCRLVTKCQKNLL